MHQTPTAHMDLLNFPNTTSPPDIISIIANRQSFEEDFKFNKKLFIIASDLNTIACMDLEKENIYTGKAVKRSGEIAGLDNPQAKSQRAEDELCWKKGFTCASNDL
jgi:hypothetical protein